jgi:hypothetical protein
MNGVVSDSSGRSIHGQFECAVTLAAIVAYAFFAAIARVAGWLEC